MNELKKFIEEVLKDNRNFDGCRYHYLDDTYALVFAWTDVYGLGQGESLCCKIAYNCDDLQCDYDWDWYMPIDKDNDVVITEIIDCQDSSVDVLHSEIMNCIDDLKSLGIMEA